VPKGRLTMTMTFRLFSVAGQSDRNDVVPQSSGPRRNSQATTPPDSRYAPRSGSHTIRAFLRRGAAPREPPEGPRCLPEWMRVWKGSVVLVAVVIAVVSFMVATKMRHAHFATYGHLLPYGWHVDVGTVVHDPRFLVPRIDPSGGLAVPAEGQWTRVLNFTILPVLVEACMNGEFPVFPQRLEKLDQATGKWKVFPIKTKVIWPLQSFQTVPIPLAKLNWIHKDDWVRIVVPAQWGNSTESHPEFVSPAFQVMESQP